MQNEIDRVRGSQAIAVVENDGEMRSMLEDFLVSIGYRVRTFKRAEEFLPSVGNAELLVSLVISEVHMDGITGLEMLRLLRESESLLPVLMITAAPNNNDQRQAEALGALAYLRKPFPLAELNAQIQKATSLTAVVGA